jgi:hypothetical protein
MVSVCNLTLPLRNGIPLSRAERVFMPEGHGETWLMKEGSPPAAPSPYWRGVVPLSGTGVRLYAKRRKLLFG